MTGFYRALSGVKANEENIVMTVTGGEHFGEKALFCASKLIFRSPEEGFFTEHMDMLREIHHSGVFQVAGETLFCERLGQEKKFVVCGGGHISIPIVQMGRMIGCHVTVLEDRPLFANHARAAGADEVICDDFTRALETIEGDEDTFFIIVTRGHRYDTDCLRAILKKPHAYIGMIGSAKRVETVKEKLALEGADRKALCALHAPIGLRIGAETPEEIAISILAEIVEVKSKSGRNSSFTREILRAILDEEKMEDGNPMRRVLATIVSRKGSAPRAAGTKMVFLRDGRTVGTIGGGCAEAELTRIAQSMLTNPYEQRQRMHRIDMTGAQAEEEGMVCGGIIDVLLEVL